jgi:hypothetical protein
MEGRPGLTVLYESCLCARAWRRPLSDRGARCKGDQCRTDRKGAPGYNERTVNEQSKNERMRQTRIRSVDEEFIDATTLTRLKAKRKAAQRLISAEKKRGHITDHDLERNHLGRVTDPKELESLEKHLLSCILCVVRATETEAYIEAMRAAIKCGSKTMTAKPSQ